jgi:hypothetical protein
MLSNRLALALLLVSASAPAFAQAPTAGEQAIQDLISSIQVIENRLELSITLTNGAVGYATIGGVTEDDAMNGALISQAMLLAYQDAVAAVLAADYNTAQNAQELFMQQHEGAMANLTAAVDNLVDASFVINQALAVQELAAVADTRPEQAALQGMLQDSTYTIELGEVVAYNDAIGAVESYAQQAGSFMAAANNSDLTASIDSFAAQNNITMGAYTAVTYVQSIDEFIIEWGMDGYTSGWNGYLTSEMQSANDLYNAGVYFQQQGNYAGL